MSKARLYSESSVPQNFLEILQAAILRKISKTSGADEPIVYEFTQDRALLHQYYRLREIMYRKLFNADLFVGEEQIYDKLSHILIARQGKLCVGGCRLTVREADETFALPMEAPDFQLRTLFPEIPLDKVRHGQLSHFAILEGHRDRNILYALSKIMYEKVINEGVHYVFAKSTLPLARNWRLIANSFGVKTTSICQDIKVPENPLNPEVNWYVTLSDLSSYCAAAAHPIVPSHEYNLELVH